MYLYLYDSFLNAQKYYKTLARIETRLTDLGIGGKISRLSPLKNIPELIKDEIRNGVKTVVAVGNDKTIVEVVNNIAEHNVCLGIIPIGKGNSIAHSLGIPRAEDACSTLSSRKLEKIDLGRVNKTYFLSGITIPDSKATIQCESQYQVRPLFGKYQITICNLRPVLATGVFSGHFDPSDGLLEILIRPAKGISRGVAWLFGSAKNLTESIFPIKKISITSADSQTIITDGDRVLKTPVEIEVVPKKLKVIVGKKRAF